MGYEEDNTKMRTELSVLEKEYERLDRYFKVNPGAKTSRNEGYFERLKYEEILRKEYNEYNTLNDSILYMQFKIIKYRINHLKYSLNQSKTQRAISKSADFMGSITPQHVSGRVYKVENGDGCGTFCIWFIIIDAIIVFILYLTGVFN